MSDDALGAVPKYNRVSIRAVLVHEGEDVSAALAEAGFVDSVAIPVRMGDDLDLSDGILGDGITPNLTGVLETEEEEDFNPSPETQQAAPPPASQSASPTAPATTNLPAAYGLQPLAPVRRVSS